MSRGSRTRRSRHAPTTRSTAHTWKRTTTGGLISLFRNVRVRFPLYVPLHVRTGGFHPYIQTMFLALGFGSLLVFGSGIYYVEVAAATKPILEGKRMSYRSAASINDSPFLALLDGIAGLRGVEVKTPPREYLQEQAEAKGLDGDLLNRIAFCESRWRMVNNRQSTAFGYFQIVDGTERLTPEYREGLSKTDPYVNIDMALSLYEKYGTAPWHASRGCWSQ